MAQNDIFGNDMVIGSGSREEPGAKKLLRANRQRVHKAAMDGSVGNLFAMNCEILENRLTCESKANTKYDTSKVINFDVDCKHIDQGIRCAAKQYVEENSLDGVTGLGLECDFKSRNHQKCKGHFATEQPSSKTLNASQKPALEINCKWTEGLNSIKCDSGTPLSELRYEDAVRYKVNCRNNLPSGMSDCVVRRGAKKSGIKRPTWFRLECERDFSNIKETRCNGAVVFEGLDYDAQNASKTALSPTTTLSTVEGLDIGAQNASKTALSPTTTLSTVEGLDIGAQNASKTALSPTTTLSTVEGLDYNAWNVSNSTSPSTTLLPTNESIPAPKDTVLIIGACFAPIFLLLVLFFVIFYRVKKRRIRKQKNEEKEATEEKKVILN